MRFPDMEDDLVDAGAYQTPSRATTRTEVGCGVGYEDAATPADNAPGLVAVLDGRR